MRKKDTSWNRVAAWYDQLLSEGQGTYQQEVILPNLMRLLAVRPGERVLDLACGQGFFSAALVHAGAAVVGVDLAPDLVAIAETKVPTATFHVAAAEHLDFLPAAGFDRAICVLALQNIREARAAVGEVGRLLKPGGVFAVVLNHPCFRIPKASAWEWDRANRQYRRVDAYLSESKARIDMHPGQKNSPTTVSYHRPLQFYFKALGRHGFGVTEVEEWASHKVSDSGPRAPEENRARREIPMFLCLVAKKI